MGRRRCDYRSARDAPCAVNIDVILIVVVVAAVAVSLAVALARLAPHRYVLWTSVLAAGALATVLLLAIASSSRALIMSLALPIVVTSATALASGVAPTRGSGGRAA